MPCLVANCAVVNSPRSASNATFALKSAEYRFRLLVIQVRLSQKRTELNLLSEFRGPPHPLLKMAKVKLRASPLYSVGKFGASTSRGPGATSRLPAPPTTR